MRVLIACEESQTVCKEFRKLGHEAFSCDIQECSGGHPEWHYQKDIFEVIDMGWDLMIGHPPCTYLSFAGIAWFNVEKYGDKARERERLKHEAIDFFLKLWNAPIDKICLENPRGYIMNSLKQHQIIHPYYFGDSFSKTTCLWLKNLPKLYHNKHINLFDQNVTHVDKGEFVYHKTKSGKIKGDAKWFYESVKLPPKERQKFRSKTFLGIAQAMAQQWGGVIDNSNSKKIL